MVDLQCAPAHRYDYEILKHTLQCHAISMRHALYNIVALESEVNRNLIPSDHVIVLVFILI